MLNSKIRYVAFACESREFIYYLENSIQKLIGHDYNDISGIANKCNKRCLNEYGLDIYKSTSKTKKPRKAIESALACAIKNTIVFRMSQYYSVLLLTFKNDLLHEMKLLSEIETHPEVRVGFEYAFNGKLYYHSAGYLTYNRLDKCRPFGDLFKKKE